MRIHKFITYFVKLLLSTRCRGASLLYMAAEEMFTSLDKGTQPFVVCDG